ncbi:GNAT family N-acetyltransferase [Actinoplanes sp. NPDC051861]|uniref:GNAT family N-acetyltransferase n=1 Tax=Actinoplanes sp. NPDC051861 TaxID=3155170 RepID=UPI00343B2942
MEIRAITPADAEFGRAAGLFDDYRVHYGEPAEPERTRVWLASQITGHRLRLAATLPGGLITYTVMPASLRLASFYAVRDLFVALDHRRSGIARALLDHVVAEAKAEGALRVSLQTEPDNAAALALYAAAGFRPVEGLTSLNLTLS